jgi:type II secretory pathway pseudopilin PulG
MVNFKRYICKRGISLIELFIVIMILGIVIVIVVARVIGMSDKAREDATKKNIKSIQATLEDYCLDYRIPYPTDVNEVIRILEERYAPLGIPKALLRRSLSNNSSAEIVAGTQPTTHQGGWMYVNVKEDKHYGGFYVNTTALDSEGVPYSSYPSRFW